jgi:GntR family transcriptional regulator
MPPRRIADAGFAADKPHSRAEALTRALAGEILEGNRPVGTLLPAEAEIAAQHAASAATVRAALRRLEALGLIARSRGSNARVISGEVRANYQIAATPAARNGDAAELGGRYAGETRVAVERRRHVQADAELAMLLGVREGSDWLHLTGVRLADDASFGPLSWVDIWIDAPSEAVNGETEFGPAGIAALTGAAVADVVEEFSAASLTPAQARHLRARGGTASLHVMRRHLRGNGALLAAVRDVHPAERVSVAVRLSGE